MGRLSGKVFAVQASRTQVQIASTHVKGESSGIHLLPQSSGWDWEGSGGWVETSRSLELIGQ